MDPLLPRLGLALAIGLLVGLERGWRERDAPDRSRTAGIRTYGIAGLVGGLLAALGEAVGSMAILAVGFVTFTAVFAGFKLREATHDEDFSVTGVIAGMAVFALGALAVAGDYVAAAAGGTALAAILASREVLHGLLRRLTWAELRSALVLAAMTVIVLPVLPDRTIDPWGGVNPHEIWVFTVLIAAISFAGYVMSRLFGETRGVLVSALAGAVVSSTAVILVLARMARGCQGIEPLAGAAALAAMVSVLRVGAVVGAVRPSVVVHAGLPIAAAALVLAAAGALLVRGGGPLPMQPAARNPFDLAPLLGFAALLAVVSTASAVLSGVLDESGLLITSAVSGTFDVDVAVLSSLRLVEQGVAPASAARAVLLALVANAVGRLFLAAVSGPVRFLLPLAAATVVAALAGAAVHLLLPPIPLPA
ncbi:MgtC/SapB family protein [Aquibium microcysteis]|uniref:MgtC/SapB family protein n=1 Tax=Aquibium microcysteis TaxID=675281 RepID=UPI00165D1DC2|nr:MgtC/SapB family protein [Aquibium microcysteis]